MELNKVQTDGFTKIIKRGMEHYNTVPYSLGHYENTNGHNVIGYVVWFDAEADFTTTEGDTKQEFYIQEDGTVCTYTDTVFKPVNFRARNWDSFKNPKPRGVKDESQL